MSLCALDSFHVWKVSKAVQVPTTGAPRYCSSECVVSIADFTRRRKRRAWLGDLASHDVDCLQRSVLIVDNAKESGQNPDLSGGDILIVD
jgi:hypothetical protein